MATTQFNTRLDEEIKAEGDEVFASFGFTPSRVVQATWGYAARNRHNKKKMQRLMELLDEPNRKEPKEEPEINWVEKGPMLYREALAQMGITGTPEPLDMPDDELLWEAMKDRWHEKGMEL